MLIVVLVVPHRRLHPRHHTHPLRHCFRKFTDPWPLFPVLALARMANLLLRQTKIPKQLCKGKCKNTSWVTKVEYPITKSSARCPVPPRFGYPSLLAFLLADQPVRAPVLSMKPVTHVPATTSIPASIFLRLMEVSERHLSLEMANILCFSIVNHRLEQTCSEVVGDVRTGATPRHPAHESSDIPSRATLNIIDISFTEGRRRKRRRQKRLQQWTLLRRCWRLI